MIRMINEMAFSALNTSVRPTCVRISEIKLQYRIMLTIFILKVIATLILKSSTLSFLEME